MTIQRLHDWKFNEGQGNTATDSVGGAVLTLQGAVWVPGRQGNGYAIRFNRNEGVTKATTTLGELPPDWTVTLWVKREGDSTSAALLSSTSHAIRLEQWEDTHLVGFTKFTVGSAIGFDEKFTYGAAINQWVQLTLVGTSKDVTLYVNGVFQQSINRSIPLGLEWIGCSAIDGDTASAILDEIQVFKGAATADEVTTIYNNGSSPAQRVWRWGQGVVVMPPDPYAPWPTAYLEKVGVVAIAGFDHALALLADGSVWTWGNNKYGQLGNGPVDGNLMNSSAPVFPNLPKNRVKAVAVGVFHSMVLLDDGTVMAWGRNDYAQLGIDPIGHNPQVTPMAVPSLSGVKAIDGGIYHSIALKDDGTVVAWGRNNLYQLGTGDSKDSRTPVPVNGLQRIKAISAGNYHNLALDEDGTVWAWGYNNYGQLGDGTQSTGKPPGPVKFTPPTKVKAIAANRSTQDETFYPMYFSLAVAEDGSVWGWGVNTYGYLGNAANTTKYSTTPLKSSVSNAKAVAASAYAGYALLEDGTVWSWGAADAMLGFETSRGRAAVPPRRVISGVKAVVALSDGCFAF